jgi:hypothetical protein
LEKFITPPSKLELAKQFWQGNGLANRKLLKHGVEISFRTKAVKVLTKDNKEIDW